MSDATATGLLIFGALREIPGLRIYAPASVGGPTFNELDPGDYMMRPTTWLRLIVMHTTGGLWPQPIHEGAGPPGHAREILEMWSGRDHGDGKHIHSGAPLIVDFNGDIYCNQDIGRCAAYAAEGANRYSVSIEMCTLPGGGIYQATLSATLRLAAMLTWSGLPGAGLLPIPFQIPRGPYLGAPLRRCEIGAGPTREQLSPADLIGIIGHQHNTSERGPGDPGREILDRLEAHGAELVDYDQREEIALARTRQVILNALDARAGLTFRPLSADGLCGPSSIAAMTRHGFRRWRDVSATGAASQPALGT